MKRKTKKSMGGSTEEGHKLDGYIEGRDGEKIVDEAKTNNNVQVSS